MTRDTRDARGGDRAGHGAGGRMTEKPGPHCDGTVIRMMRNGILVKHPGTGLGLSRPFTGLLRSNLEKYAPGAAAYFAVTAYCDGLSLDDRAVMFAWVMRVIRLQMPGLAGRIMRDMDDTLGRGGQ